MNVPEVVQQFADDLALELGDGARITVAPDTNQPPVCSRWVVTGTHPDRERPVTHQIVV